MANVSGSSPTNPVPGENTPVGGSSPSPGSPTPGSPSTTSQGSVTGASPLSGSGSPSSPGSPSTGQLMGRTVSGRLSPAERDGLEAAFRRRREIGNDIRESMTAASEGRFIGTEASGFRPARYIASRARMADLAIAARSELGSQPRPIARRGGSANEVFITPNFVLKVAGSAMSRTSMIQMERFVHNFSHILGIDDVVLPTIPVRLTAAQARNLSLTPTAQSQANAQGEITASIAHHVQFQSPERCVDYDETMIDLENYQMAALFSGITQQTDHHQDNGGIVYDDEAGNLKFILFDNDICMHESNALIQMTGDGGRNVFGVPIRSFFLAFALKSTPLTANMVRLINSWTPTAIAAFLDGQRDIPLTPKQRQACLDRINNVKNLVNSNPRATIQDCFNAMYPLLAVYQELYALLNPRAVFTNSVALDSSIMTCSPGGGPCSPLTEMLTQALARGLISQSRYDVINAQITAFQRAGDVATSFSA